jgi:hypothetical protein
MSGTISLLNGPSNASFALKGLAVQFYTGIINNYYSRIFDISGFAFTDGTAPTEDQPVSGH